MKKTNQVILVIGAHPDDPEFGCGATTAKLAKNGAEVYYVICTGGQRGSRHNKVDGKILSETRKIEQQQAAKILGIREVFFLDHEDGNLSSDIILKEELVKIIRKIKPTKVFTHDPYWIYSIGEEYSFINHNDHRATGTATLDAIYPLSRDLASFPSHQEEGLNPHKVLEVYLFSPHIPNHFEDVSDYFENKYQAILAHKSQVDEPEKIKEWMEKRLSESGKKAGFKYAESFIKLVLR